MMGCVASTQICPDVRALPNTRSRKTFSLSPPPPETAAKAPDQEASSLFHSRRDPSIHTYYRSFVSHDDLTPDIFLDHLLLKGVDIPMILDGAPVLASTALDSHLESGHNPTMSPTSDEERRHGCSLNRSRLPSVLIPEGLSVYRYVRANLSWYSDHMALVRRM